MLTPPRPTSIVQPALLSRINEWRVLRAIRQQGSMSRAEVARFAGITAPTASKTVESLLREGWLVEEAATEMGRGRPAKRLRLPDREAQVLGVVVDAPRCRLAVAGLDGVVRSDSSVSFPTPATYDELLDEITIQATALIQRSPVPTLGIGISQPGLVDYNEQRGLLSPNVHITDGHSPVKDLAARLELPAVMLQEQHAHCLSERLYGHGRDQDDFAILDIWTGLGIGVVLGGRLLTGHRGLAGEFGHMTVRPEGKLCGCGNRGCLETEASDLAFAAEVSRRCGREVHPNELVSLLENNDPDAHAVLESVSHYLSIAVGAIINIFNPRTLVVYGRVLQDYAPLLPRVLEEARSHSLAPSFASCNLFVSRSSKIQGAVAAILEHLMNSRLPEPLRYNQSFGGGSLMDNDVPIPLIK